ncbi:hypothetical protein G9A89_001365 [Geosiphon pyriformis]|nr:hypothetical protein G9A89_001365 [Geosiphon pyriformis]
MGNFNSKTHEKQKDLRAKSSKSSNELDEIFYLPRVDCEMNRQQSAHFLFQHIFQCRFSAPMEETLLNGSHVLDMGCGPGAWVCEMATYYPQTKFIGIDILDVFPKEIKPANATFQIGNLTDGLPFEDKTFDMVRISCLYISMTGKEYRFCIDEAIRVLKSGGYIEIIEAEFQLENPGKNWKNCLNSLQKIFGQRGINLWPPPNLVRILEEIKVLQEIQFERRLTKLGPEGGMAGVIFLDNINQYFTGTIATVFSEKMGLSEKDYNDFWENCKKEALENGSEAPISKFWAQKI